MKVDDDKYIAYRVRVLPDQLALARRRVAQLEREAERLGMRDLLHDKAQSSASQMAVS